MLESQRAVLGDAAVDAVLAPLRAQLEALQAEAPAPEPAPAPAPAPVPAPAPAPPAQVLRQVTVLFLDVVGSTTLAQHLDPEDIHAVMDGALARCTTVVQAHRGKVLQYAGDNLLAAFGADEAREDDAERAVRAGLALLDEGRLLGQAVAQRHGHQGFDVRVGIHTGLVLLGGGVDEEGTIRGMTVHVAARMEQTAPAGSLRISHDTWQLVRGLFEVEPQAPLLVKGRDEPVLTYLVQRARPRAFRMATRGIEGLTTRMVGRDAEFARLKQAFDALLAGGPFAALLVVADAGIGKSRLLFEFEGWAASREARFTVFRGRANPQTEAVPYGLLRDIVAWWLDIADGDSMAVARQKVESGIAPLFVSDDGEALALEQAHVLGHLIGLDFGDSPHLQAILADGRQVRSRGFHVAAQMLRRIHARDGAPLLLLLDDLHWSDEPSLDFLAHLAEACHDLPLLLVGLTRPTLHERRPDFLDGVAQRITLVPLGDQSSDELASELLRKLAEVPTALRELVTGRAEGNPFYMEEVVMMLVDEGAIDASGEPWQVIEEKLRATPVPHTLTGVLQARLDSLRAAERLALQQASVVGFVFWDQALAAIDAQSAAALPTVARRELVVAHEEGDFDGAREYAFRHHLLHQVTYETVLKRARRAYHARAAAWLTSLTGARANDFLGVTAEHFENAGDVGNACEYHARAAEHAAARFAHDALLAHVARALALAGDDDTPSARRLRWRLLALRERALDLLGHRADQSSDIEQLVDLADTLGDDRLRADAAWRRCDIALRMGDFRGSERSANEAMTLAGRAGVPELALRAQQRLVLARNSLGDHASARALALEGLASARRLGLPEAEMRFTNAMEAIAWSESDLVAQLRYAAQSLRLSRETGDRRTESIELCNLGTSLLGVGEHDDAGRHLEAGLHLTRSLGIRTSETVVLSNLSELALRTGDAARALALAQAAAEVAEAVKDPGDEAFALVMLGDAWLALDRPDEAAAAFARARDVAAAVDDPLRFQGQAGLARAALAQRDDARALAEVEPLLLHVAEEDADDAVQEMMIWLTCWRVLRQAGDGRAASVLATAHAALQARAATIDEPKFRDGFLHRVPEHHAIVTAWAEDRASNAAPS